jgi:hypothetical protein
VFLEDDDDVHRFIMRSCLQRSESTEIRESRARTGDHDTKTDEGVAIGGIEVEAGGGLPAPTLLA